MAGRIDSTTRAVIGRYYVQLWNQWDFHCLDELIAADIVFRGSLGVDVRGRDEFQRYMANVRAAFPDFENIIEELIIDGERAASRLTYRGTHQGPLFGVKATGCRIEYRGAAFFRVVGGQIAEGWVLGDTASLWRQIGSEPRQL